MKAHICTGNRLFECLEKGGIYPEYKGLPDACRFETQSNQMTLFVMLKNPTQMEIFNYSSNADAEFGLFLYKKILFLTAKFGNEEVIDCPYNPTLYPIKPDPYKLGNALTIRLYDTATGKLINLRLLGLDNAFSMRLQNTVNLLNQEKITKQEYASMISSVYSTYTSDEMHRMAFAKWKISDSKKVG